ncbi:MAG: ribosome-associated translation inhibitor RaiA, partial [Firmicutes bacterium]|nr:ribosome-associated translation inhibitor RaiA [Bacillota bacterium]
MKINISSKDYVVADRLKNVIEKKLSRMQKYFGDDAVCSVFCKKEGRVEKMEVSITSKGQTYRGEVHTGNMYANVDVILPKIEKQLIKHKDKLQT